MDTIYYIAGEIKPCRVRISVKDDPNTKVTVSSAKWELHRKNGQVIESGFCTISDDILSWMMEIKNRGRYCLCLTCYIGTAIIIRSWEVYCRNCH
mgnify:CR=1 FL=1